MPPLPSFPSKFPCSYPPPRGLFEHVGFSYRYFQYQYPLISSPFQLQPFQTLPHGHHNNKSIFLQPEELASDWSNLIVCLMTGCTSIMHPFMLLKAYGEKKQRDSLRQQHQFLPTALDKKLMHSTNDSKHINISNVSNDSLEFMRKDNRHDLYNEANGTRAWTDKGKDYHSETEIQLALSLANSTDQSSSKGSQRTLAMSSLERPQEDIRCQTLAASFASGSSPTVLLPDLVDSSMQSDTFHSSSATPTAFDTARSRDGFEASILDNAQLAVDCNQLSIDCNRPSGIDMNLNLAQSMNSALNEKEDIEDQRRTTSNKILQASLSLPSIKSSRCCSYIYAKGGIVTTRGSSQGNQVKVENVKMASSSRNTSEGKGFELMMDLNVVNEDSSFPSPSASDCEEIEEGAIESSWPFRLNISVEPTSNGDSKRLCSELRSPSPPLRKASDNDDCPQFSCDDIEPTSNADSKSPCSGLRSPSSVPLRKASDNDDCPQFSRDDIDLGMGGTWGLEVGRSASLPISLDEEDILLSFLRNPKRLCTENVVSSTKGGANCDSLKQRLTDSHEIKHSITSQLRSWSSGRDTRSTRLQLQLMTDSSACHHKAQANTKVTVEEDGASLSLGLERACGGKKRSHQTEKSELSGELAGLTADSKSDRASCSMKADPIDKLFSSKDSGAASENVEGMKLLDLLLKCATAVSENQKPAVKSLLGELYKKASLYGDSMQRLAVYFAEGIVARLARKESVIHKKQILRQPTGDDMLQTFATFNKVTPFVHFAHFTANQAIMEAVEGEERIHVVDMNIQHGCQWPPLIESLARRTSGKPVLVKITGVGSEGAGLRQTGARLRRFADSCGINLEFEAVVVPEKHASEQVEALQQCEAAREGQATVVNCVMQLHRLLCDGGVAIESFADGVRKLGARIVTVVEAEANHNGPGFVGRFVEALQYYAAIFDALDASLPKRSPERLRIEKFFLGCQIKNILACDGSERVQRHEPAELWQRRLRAAGLRQRRFSTAAVIQAKLLLEMRSCQGYRLSELQGGFLSLGWQDKNLVTASAWSP